MLFKKIGIEISSSKTNIIYYSFNKSNTVSDIVG